MQQTKVHGKTRAEKSLPDCSEREPETGHQTRSWKRFLGTEAESGIHFLASHVERMDLAAQTEDCHVKHAPGNVSRERRQRRESASWFSAFNLLKANHCTRERWIWQRTEERACEQLRAAQTEDCRSSLAGWPPAGKRGCTQLEEERQKTAATLCQDSENQLLGNFSSRPGSGVGRLAVRRLQSLLWSCLGAACQVL